MPEDVLIGGRQRQTRGCGEQERARIDVGEEHVGPERFGCLLLGLDELQ